MNKLEIWNEWKKYWLRDFVENGTNSFEHPIRREEQIAFIYITLSLNWDLKQLFKNDCMF